MVIVIPRGLALVETLGVAGERLVTAGWPNEAELQGLSPGAGFLRVDSQWPKHKIPQANPNAVSGTGKIRIFTESDDLD